MAKTTISLLLISAVPVLGFVLPGGWIASKMLSARDPGRALRSTLVPRVSSLVRLKMMSQDDEWFNPNAIQRLAQSVPLKLKPDSIPEMPEPILLEGALDWGYYTGMSWEGRGKGTQASRKSNQDSIMASSLDSSILFGVFDGHGEFGGEASTQIAQMLPTNVYEVEQAIITAGMDEAAALTPFVSAYTKTHQQLLDQGKTRKGFDTFLSGSTCITVLVAGDKGSRRVVVANAGDCRAIIGTDGWGGKSVTSQLSVDQTPDRPDERARIEGMGGIVGMVNPNQFPMAVLSPEEAAILGVDLGPVRVFWPDGSFEPPYESCFPGLAMSRSLGDECLDDIGVLPVPEVTIRSLKPKDRFLVIASDGVWQVLSNDEVAQIVTKAGGDATAACQGIFASASVRWQRERSDDGLSYRDDISMFVVYFTKE